MTIPRSSRSHQAALDRGAWSSATVLAMAVALSLLSVLLIAGTAAVFVAQYPCPPTGWAESAVDELTALVPAGTGQTDSAIADCDAEREVSVFFEDSTVRPVDGYRAVLIRAAVQGWSHVEGEPWWGCWTKRIKGLNTWMRVHGSPEDASYVIQADRSAGYCNGGRWQEENPENWPVGNQSADVP